MTDSIPTNSHDSLGVPLEEHPRKYTISLPQSPSFDDPNFDIIQFLSNDSTCETSFENLLTSSPPHSQNQNETIGSRPSSQSSLPTQDRTDKRYYPPLTPLKLHHSISPGMPTINTRPELNGNHCQEDPISPNQYNRPASYDPSGPHRCAYAARNVVHKDTFHSPIDQEASSFPSTDPIYINHSRPHYRNALSNSIHPSPSRTRRVVKYSHLPSEPYESSYSHSFPNARSLSQSGHDPQTPNQTYARASDQFYTPSHLPNSRKNSTPFPMQISGISCSPIPATYIPVCKNCGCENRFEFKECSQGSQASVSQTEDPFGFVSTQDSVFEPEDSICSSQISNTQTSVLSETPSLRTEQHPFDSVVRITHDLTPKEDNSATARKENCERLKKEQRKKKQSKRERERVRDINLAFKELGDVCSFHTNERAATKIGTLEQAISLLDKINNDLKLKREESQLRK